MTVKDLIAMCNIEKQNSLTQIEKLVASPHEILIDSDGEGGFIASIPSLPGCLSCGETQDEAMENVMDAKHAWITAAMEDGIAIPDPVLPEPFLAQTEKTMVSQLKLSQRRKNELYRHTLTTKNRNAH